MQIQLSENVPANSYNGEIEIIIKSSKTGQVLEHIRQPNIVKIFGKEILAQRMGHSKVWDPTGGTGNGAWVASGIDPDEDFAVKYILFGASFDENGAPLDTTDTRYYQTDQVTGTPIPITLGVGAEYNGGLINAVPITEPTRPLKRIERIYSEPTYQPSGTPLLQSDVRAMNNIMVFETTLTSEEYNGFGLTNSDFFTITEVALAAGREIDSVGSCECDPTTLFLEGRSDGTPITVNGNGTATVSVDGSDSAYVDTIKEGDQVKIVSLSDTEDDLGQVTPYYLVINKNVGGSDIVLDRAVVDSDGNGISGSLGIYRNTLRIFSHRILNTPFKKSESFEITCRWTIRMA